MNNNNNNDNIIGMNNNERNNVIKAEGIKILNSLKSLKSINEDKMNENNNETNNDNNNGNIDNIGYQTYSGPFRKNIIKVNIIEKDSNDPKLKNEKTKSVIVENDIMNSNIKNMKYITKNNNGSKSSSNLKKSISNSLKKNDKKDLFIDTDFKNAVKNNNNNKIIDADGTINSSKQKEISTCLNYKNNIFCFNNNLKSDKNINSNNVINTLNLNIYPLSRDNTKTFSKNKSNNIINEEANGNSYYANNTNRSSVMQHKKNNSISSCCYNTQRYNNDNKMTKYKNSYNNKNNYLYSPKKSKMGKYINNKSVVVPEYRVKLDNIKSRVVYLLNIYSLLALKSANNINSDN
jgi:hypothetical protein